MVKCLSCQKQRWYNVTKLSNSPESWLHYRSLKREGKKQCRLTYHQYINSLVDPSSRKTTKKLRSFIKSKRIDQCIIPLYRWMTLLLLIVTLRPKPLAITSSQYSQVKIHLRCCTWRELLFQTCHLFPISIEKVYHQLSKLQPIQQVSRPDNIPAYFFKRTAPLIAPILFLIFQSPLNQRTLPSAWKMANIIPICKKGNRPSQATTDQFL